jgi:hypothetical protein
MNNEVTRVKNVMGEMRKNDSVQAESKVAHEIAEVQAQVVMAKQFPRNKIQCMENVLNECTRPKLAEKSTYAYPRGGMTVTGPSIRLAEVIARNWGNIDFGIREVEQVNGESVVEAFCWDLENNVRERKVFKVPHIRYSKKKGNTKLTDPRDIYELVANQGARRLRSCILGVIPSDVIDNALEQCALTANASADTSKEGIKRIVDGFKPYSIEQEHIELFIGSKIGAIQSAQVVRLREIYASIKDGMSKPWDWFDVKRPEEKEVEKVKTDLFKDDKKEGDK